MRNCNVAPVLVLSQCCPCFLDWLLVAPGCPRCPGDGARNRQKSPDQGVSHSASVFVSNREPGRWDDRGPGAKSGARVGSVVIPNRFAGTTKSVEGRRRMDRPDRSLRPTCPPDTGSERSVRFGMFCPLPTRRMGLEGCFFYPTVINQ